MRCVRILTAVVVLSAVGSAQWLNYSPPGTPLARDGKPNLSAPAPRMADGKPDLTGTWMHETTTVAEVKRLFGSRFDDAINANSLGMEIGTQHKYGLDILADFKTTESPLRPAAIELMRRFATARNNGGDVCREISGFPRADLLSEPIKIVQAPRETIVLYEVENLHRQIFADGRKMPKEFDLPAFMGYSVGHWDGDTFVVETAGFNEKTPLDNMGHPHSDALRVTERFRRRDYGHLDYELTLDDPKMYTQPITLKIPHQLLPESDVFEMFCNENEKDRAHLTKN